jgi:FlaA1/EpsC-like NDP-sugar epimerase
MNLPAWLRTQGAAFVHDLAMIPLAWLGAFWLRFNLGPVPDPFLQQALYTLPVLVAVQGGAYFFFGLYRGVWRFASLPDLVRIVKAVLLALATAAVLLFLIFRLQWIPRSVFPLYGVLMLLALGGPRFMYRLTKDRGLYLRQGRRVLIVGAGRGGDMLMRDLLRDPDHKYLPVGFLDDDRRKWSADVQGVRVWGGCTELPRFVQQLEIDLVLLAMPSASHTQMRRLVELCEQAGVEFRTLPRVEDLVSGRASLGALREVSIEDLLGRETVGPDWAQLRAGITGRRVLVTGGGGSIGSELCRQIARLHPQALVVVEIGEFALYRLEQELNGAFPDLALTPLLGDVTDVQAMDRVFVEHTPNLVFHAAAYKHVPILERQVREAVRNNVLGTRIVADAVARHGSDAFVLISTDKAVNPCNVLGASKRVAELVCESFNGRSTSRFITVRFGNVLGSSGSVVPLFRRQIARGGPVTVTDPEITRYFMTISEACQLILQAALMGQGGEVFVLDMGEPVRIVYLAEQLIRLVGKAPGEDIEIVYTGLRPGEKMHEELFLDGESVSTTSHEKIRQALYQDCDTRRVNSVLDEMAWAVVTCDEAALRTLLDKLLSPAGGAQAAAADEVRTVVAFRSPAL